MPIKSIPEIKTDDITVIYAGLHEIGRANNRPGYDRPAYSDAESAAMQYIAQQAEAGGLHSRRDAVGNLIVETPGEFSQWVETGSHIDTVPGGGNYDGVAGVVTGLAVLLAVQRSGVKLENGLRLRVWRGEESASFGVVSVGSRAAFGVLPKATLIHSHEGQTLAEAMRDQGADLTCIEQGVAALPQQEIDSIAAMIELHIEQGNVLEREGVGLGVVTGIRGSLRSWVSVRGAFDHSGATPMGLPYRHDANLAMAYMQVRLDELAQQYLARGEDVVQTIGVINSGAETIRRMPEIADTAISRVSAAACFSHEVRSCSAELADCFAVEAFDIIRSTALEFGVQVEIDSFSRMPGVPLLDNAIGQLLANSCEAVDASWRSMPSGAWHDAAVLCGVRRSDGSAIPVGMLFTPCREGISHSANEFVSDDQLALGATVLLQTMLSLASHGAIQHSMVSHDSNNH